MGCLSSIQDMSNARLVRTLRGLVLTKTPVLPCSVVTKMLEMLSILTFTPKQTVSLLASVSILRERCPVELQAALFRYVSANISTDHLKSLSVHDLSQAVLSFGFLVKAQAAGTTDHTRVGEALVQTATEKLTPDARIVRNLTKGVAMLRLPLSSNLLKFFKSLPTSGLSIDEHVFVLRAAVDYGIFPPDIIKQILTSDLTCISASSASSLLYSLAMCGVLPDRDTRKYIVESALEHNVVIAMWCCKILGIRADHILQTQADRLAEALNSSNPKERAMAEFVQGLTRPVSSHLKQSAAQVKLKTHLEEKYGPLLVEYEVVPGVVCDYASPATKTALEIDGPSHFLVDLSSGLEVRNGPTKFKENQLIANGWTTVSVRAQQARFISNS